ncbi:MAG: aldo/keto reductase [Caldilineaceae bacterium]|nr:aldo/keto reductase [Caldilineaceae bacterium]
MTANTIQNAQVGTTGLQVTRLGMGTAPIGNLYEPLNDAEALETVQRSYEHGIRFFDTAPLYGAGEAERRLGAALRGVPRDEVIIQTKVGRIIRPDRSIYFDYSRDGVMKSFEDSLERLGMDRVDILLVHDPDYENAEAHHRQSLDEAFPTLLDLRAQGVIGAVGAGMNQWEMEWEFAKNVDVNCFLLAGRYTLLEQTSLDFLDWCTKNDVSIFLGGVYNSGILATGPIPGAKYDYEDAPEEILTKAGSLQEITTKYGVPLHVAALHFAGAHPAIASLVIGSATAAEADDNRTIWDVKAPAAMWQELQDSGLIAAEAPLPA